MQSTFTESYLILTDDISKADSKWTPYPQFSKIETKQDLWNRFMSNNYVKKNSWENSSPDWEPAYNDGTPWVNIGGGYGCKDFNVLNSTSIDFWDCTNDHDPEDKTHDPWIFHFNEDGTEGRYDWYDGNTTLIRI